MSQAIEEFQPVISKLSNYPIRTLVEMNRDGTLITNPDIQRRFCWNLSISSKLIDSVIRNIPLPLFFLNETLEGDLEVIDGKQRITAILSFVSGYFPLTNKPFKLVLSKSNPINGKTFKDLPKPYQNRILNYQIPCQIFLKDNDPYLKEDVFIRLNGGGKKLNAMELRNCTKHRVFPKFLDELSNNSLFRKMSGFKEQDTRMLDVEWCLAFIAYYNTGWKQFNRAAQSYYLTDEFKKNINITEEEKSKFRIAFETGLKNSKTILGESAFWPMDSEGSRDTYVNKRRPYGRMGLFTALMATFADAPETGIFDNRHALKKHLVDLLKNNTAFNEAICIDTKAGIVYRHESVETIARSVLGERFIPTPPTPVKIASEA